MVKIEDIKTPETIEEFRHNLKKYCLGNNDSIFIYSRINRRRYEIEVNKLLKMSDVLEFIRDVYKQNIAASECNIILMCDLSNINFLDLMTHQEKAINSLRKVYFFNNQDSEEKSNFLNSTPYAIEKIVSGEKIIDKLYAKPKQTSINLDVLSGLYHHLFGECFDTVDNAKTKYNLSKYN